MATDIKNDANLSTNLISVWLSDDSGLTSDLHGSNTLTDNNTVTLLDDGGKNGDAGDFESDNVEYLSITDGDQTGLGITGDFSISMWIKLETIFPDSTANVSLVGKFNPTGDNRSYIITYSDNQVSTGGDEWILRSSTDGTAGNLDTWVIAANGGTLSTDTWYHVVFVFDASASEFEVYLNAASEGTNTQGNTSIQNGTADFEIANNSSGAIGTDDHLDGVMHQVAIWNKVLTSTEVSDLYNSGNGIPYEGAVTTTNPLFSFGGM